MSSKLDDLQGIVNNMDQGNNNNSETLIKQDHDDVLVKSELSNMQVKMISRLKTLSNITGNSIISQFVDTFLHAQVSLNRQSRREFIMNNQSLLTHEEQKAGGVMNWLKEKV